MLKNTDKPQRNQNFPWQTIGEETIILASDKMLSYEMSSSASFIWNQLDGTKSIQDISEKLCSEFDVQAEEALQDAILFVTQLDQAGLIQ